MALRLAGHVVIGSSTPSEDPVTVGYVWADTSQNKLKICTSVSPITFTEIGGSGATAWGAITGTLSAQTDLQSALDAKQPLDADLTAIAGLTATTDNFMVAASSAWASRTPTQAKTSLALVKADVGLGNVDNTSDASKPVSTATQTALDLKQSLSEKATASGYASLDSGTKVPIAQVPTGQTSSTVPFGNDARFTDSRTPLAHAASHKTGGSDAIKLDEFAATTDVTTLNSSTTAHGLLPKLDNNAAHWLDGTGAWTAVVAGAAARNPSLRVQEVASYSLPADYSFIVTRKYLLASGQKFSVAAGACFQVK